MCSLLCVNRAAFLSRKPPCAGFLYLFLFQPAAVLEGIADHVSQLPVGIVNRLEGNGLELVRVDLPVLAQNPVIGADVHDLADDVSFLGSVQEFTFQGHGELVNDGGIYELAFPGMQAGFFQLVRHLVMLNPQCAYGADVISRIQRALSGDMNRLTASIRGAMSSMIETCCRSAGVKPEEIGVISVVGNPCMQQLFLGLSPENLAKPPFAPVLVKPDIIPARESLPMCPDAKLLIVPDISGYVGADTVGCVLATDLLRNPKTTLLVDIGTNGEMVLAHRSRAIACSTAAGPALEGAGIRFGMRGVPGAIDHVWAEHSTILCSTIGSVESRGICGSGLIDAVAVLLELGLINARGRIQSTDELDGQRIIRLTKQVYLTQEDIRVVQMAKGAIAAEIVLMAAHLDISVSQIECVYLAGAFGNFLNSGNACRIGLLPPELRGKTISVGNAAGSGARMMVCDQALFQAAGEAVEHIEFLELASLPEFQRVFASQMRFPL